MPTITPTDLRTKRASCGVYLSILQPVTLLTAQINNASIARGDRSIAYDSGTGSGFSAITAGQTLEVDTADGTYKIRVKSITGNQTSGTITVDENGIVWADNQTLRIKHLYEPHPIPPAIRSGVFYKFYNTTYSNQNSQPNPVAIIGSHRAGLLSSGSITFQLNSSSSYAIANGASISSRVWSCVRNGGGTSGITFSSTTAANPTLTITVAGQYWLACTVTDSNGKTQTTYRALFVHDRSGGNAPYTDFSLQSLSGDWQSGWWKANLNVTGDATLTDFPDDTIVVLWYENFFNGTESYINLWGISDNVLLAGYLRQDTDQDNFTDGTGAVSFQISTIDDLLNNLSELGSVSLGAVSSPSKWYEYASWMTAGRSIHHLILWHAWGVLETCDVIGLTTNTLGVKNTDYTESTLLQQVNNFAYNRGIFAKLVSDRLGRLHLVADSQMLNDASRAALDTVFTITEADVSGVVDVVRQPEQSITLTELNGFAFNGSTSTPYVSIIPGYRTSGVTYNIPEQRGGSTVSIGNQVLASQTDSNEKTGRYHALQNNNPRELRFANPSNYIGAFDIVPSAGWYQWGISDADLKRQLELNGKLFVCRHVDVTAVYEGESFTGFLQTNVVLEKEAVGPDGIQGNYPTGYPSFSKPSPDWNSDSAQNVMAGYFSNSSAASPILGVGLIASPLQVGTPTTLDADNAESFAICGLTSTRTLFVYDDATGIRARVLTVAGTSISAIGAENSLYSGGNTVYTLIGLTSTKAVLIYNATGTKAAVLTISGDTVTIGTPTTLTGLGITPANTRGVRLSDTSLLVAVFANSTEVQAAVWTATTTVTEGSYSNASTSVSIGFGDITNLDDDSAIIVYRATATDEEFRASVLYNISSSFTLGNDIELDTADLSLDDYSVARIGDTTAIAVYAAGRDVLGDTVLSIQAIGILHDGAGTISAGTDITLESATLPNNLKAPTVVAVSSTKAIIMYNQYVSPEAEYTNRARTVTISGTSLTNDNNETEVDNIGTAGDDKSLLVLAKDPTI